MHSTIRRSLPAALAATLVAGAVAIPAIADARDDASTAASAEDTEDREDTDTEDAARRHGPELFGPGLFGLHHDLEQGELVERLATELGLDTDRVQAAVDAVRADLATERLATAVEDGRLTQEQADRIAAAIAAGDEEAVRAVVDEVRLARLEERLAERVEAGELTQEEADEVLAAAEDGDWPGHHGRRGRHGPRG